MVDTLKDENLVTQFEDLSRSPPGPGKYLHNLVGNTDPRGLKFRMPHEKNNRIRNVLENFFIFYFQILGRFEE